MVSQLQAKQTRIAGRSYIEQVTRPDSKSEPFAKNHQIDGESLKQSRPSKFSNIFVAQLITRGMVKERLMHARKWEIRTQAPRLYWCAVHRLNVGWRKLKIQSSLIRKNAG